MATSIVRLERRPLTATTVQQELPAPTAGLLVLLGATAGLQELREDIADPMALMAPVDQLPRHRHGRREAGLSVQLQRRGPHLLHALQAAAVSIMVVAAANTISSRGLFQRFVTVSIERVMSSGMALFSSLVFLSSVVFQTI